MGFCFRGYIQIWLGAYSGTSLEQKKPFILLAYAFYPGSLHFPNLLKTIYLDLSIVLFFALPEKKFNDLSTEKGMKEMRSFMLVVLDIALSSSAFWDAAGDKKGAAEPWKRAI